MLPTRTRTVTHHSLGRHFKNPVSVFLGVDFFLIRCSRLLVRPGERTGAEITHLEFFALLDADLDARGLAETRPPEHGHLLLLGEARPLGKRLRLHRRVCNASTRRCCYAAGVTRRGALGLTSARKHPGHSCGTPRFTVSAPNALAYPHALSALCVGPFYKTGDSTQLEIAFVGRSLRWRSKTIKKV